MDKEIEDLRSRLAVLRAKKSKAGKRNGGGDGYGNCIGSRGGARGEIYSFKDRVGARDGREQLGDVGSLSIECWGGLGERGIFCVADNNVLGWAVVRRLVLKEVSRK